MLGPQYSSAENFRFDKRKPRHGFSAVTIPSSSHDSIKWLRSLPSLRPMRGLY